MCATCGCSGDEHMDHHDPAGAHDHDHTHDHVHEHRHDHPHEHRESRTVRLEQDVLLKNNRLAERNRGFLEARRVRALNLMSSPGSGKTTLLERTIERLRDAHAIGVIEGDQETARDAERIRAAGAEAVQINTGKGCHLDAAMVAGALRTLDPKQGSLLFIENVGNLVCPALFDLGEGDKILICSVTEGEDKPLKYPYMFRACQILVVTKIDLLPHLDFDRDRFLANARMVNPRLRIFEVSARQGTGLDAWCGFLTDVRALHQER